MTAPAIEWPEAEQRIAAVARTRRGRHRDKALASYRRTRAIELRAQGLGYAEIAREVGYSNKGTAHKVIAQALEAREADDVDFLRQVAGDRLERLHEALWPQAVHGDLEAVRGLLRVIEAQCRLRGLYPDMKRDPKASWPSCAVPATVVIHPLDCRHAGCAQHGSF